MLQLLANNDRKEFNQIILKETIELFSADGSIFLVYEKASEEFSTKAKEGITEKEFKESIHIIKQVLFQDTYNEKSILNVQIKRFYFSFIPVFQNTDLITILVIKKQHLITEKLQGLLEEFKELIRIAFEGSNSNISMLRKSEGHKIMNKLHELVGLGSFEEILSEATDKIGSLLNTTTVGIMLYNEDTSELVLQKPAFGIWNNELIDRYKIPLQKGGNAVSVFLTGVPTLTNDAYKEKNFFHELLPLFGDHKAVITVPLSVHSKRIGVLHAGKSNGTLTENDLDVLLDITYHLGMIINGALQMKDPPSTLFNGKEIESFIRNRLVQGVLKGDSQDLEYWLTNGQMLRLPLVPPFTAIVMELKESGLENLNWPEDQIDSLERLVRKSLPISGIHVEDHRLVIFCTYEKHRDWTAVSINVKKDLLPFIDKYSNNKPLEILIGFGSAAPTLNELGESYKRAIQVLKYVPLLTDKIGFYSEMATWTLLAELSVSQNEVAHEFVETHLQLLNSLKGNTESKRTLEIYLLNERHIKRTADELFIHPNTLRYRINNIEQKINLDLSDYETRLNLILAFRLEKLL